MKITIAILVATSISIGALFGAKSIDTSKPDSDDETAQGYRDESVDFKNDLIPMFTKLGCNAGKCHGSAIGRGEFKLSLYGGTPKSD